MNLIEEYVAYLKDNPEGYWFKRKLYGYGWMPARPQGCVVLGFYLLFVLGLAVVAPHHVHESNTVSFIITPIAAATVLLLVVVWRTGESPKWQWGMSKKR